MSCCNLKARRMYSMTATTVQPAGTKICMGTQKTIGLSDVSFEYGHAALKGRNPQSGKFWILHHEALNACLYDASLKIVFTD